MFSHAFAAFVAGEFMDVLVPVSERIEIVGSIRRLSPTVNDIDMIAIPRFIQSTDDTLFGEPIRLNLLDQKLAELCLNQSLLLEANGEKIKRFRKHIGKQTISIDLYIAAASTWWTLLLIRTGSREHNIALASKAIELHMQLKADGSGLLSPGGCLIQIHSEEEIFQRLNVPFRMPSERN